MLVSSPAALGALSAANLAVSETGALMAGSCEGGWSAPLWERLRRVISGDPVSPLSAPPAPRRPEPAPGPHFVWMGLPIPEGTADRTLQGWFTSSITAAGMIRSLMDGVPELGVGTVHLGQYFGIRRIEFSFQDSARAAAGLFVNKFEEEGGDGALVAEDARIEIVPRLRGHRMGTRLMTNFIEWCRSTGRVDAYRFHADKMGAVAWSRLAAIETSEGDVQRIRARLVRLGWEHDLNLDHAAILRLDSVGRIGKFVLAKDPPQSLIAYVQGLYKGCGVSLTGEEAERRSRRIGDVALLLTGYDGRFDSTRS